MSGPQPPGSITYTSLPPSRNPWPLRLLRATTLVAFLGVWYYYTIWLGQPTATSVGGWCLAAAVAFVFTLTTFGGLIGFIVLLLWVWFGDDVNR